MINICFSIKTESKIKNHLKRETSIMEYFNNFFREDNLSQNIYDAPNFSNNYKKKFSNNIRLASNDEYINSNFQNENLKKFNFKELSRKFKNENYNRNYDKNRHNKAMDLSENKNYSTSPSENKNKTEANDLKKHLKKKLKKHFKKTTELITANWFMISSSVFLNSEKYPPIQIDSNIMVKIQTDENNFRINNAFENSEGTDKPISKKSFWLRLSDLNLYYSSSKCDLNVLGVISISHLISTSSLSTEFSDGVKIFCFKVSDKSDELWKICGLVEDTVKDLYCHLNVIMHSNEKFCKSKKDKTYKHPHKQIIQPLIIFPKPSRQCNENWNYAQKGKDWECDCIEGKEQSPIDLPKHDEAIDSPISPLFHYFRVKAKIEYDTVDGLLREGDNLKIQIIQNSLRIIHPNFGKIITVDGSVYKAEEIVMHTPSEHTLNGKNYDAELQVIHYGQSKGDIAKQIILSFLFENTPGEYNKFFESIDAFNLPNVISKERSLCGDVFIPEVFYSSEEKEEITSLKKFSFFTYQGSLTTPPCTENTIMYVASKPIPLSSTTLRLMQEAIRIPDYQDEKNNLISSDIPPENNRVIKERNGRPVFYFDHEKYCGPDQPKKKEENGHYEKIKVKKNNIFYVNDNRPSGLPEAFVISKDEAFGNDFINKIKQNFIK